VTPSTIESSAPGQLVNVAEKEGDGWGFDRFPGRLQLPSAEVKGGATKRLQCTKLHLDIFNVVKQEAWSESTLSQAIQAVAYLMSLSLLSPRSRIQCLPGYSIKATFPHRRWDGINTFLLTQFLLKFCEFRCCDLLFLVKNLCYLLHLLNLNVR
jgi:hypothetical protein